MQNGVRGEMKQITTVEEGNNLHSLGKDVVIDLLDPGLDSRERGACVGSFLQQHGAFHHVRCIDELAILVPVGLRYLTQAHLGTLLDVGDVPDADGCAVLRLDQGVLYLLNVLVQAHRLHIDLLGACDDEAAAGISVIALECLLDLADAEAIADQLIGIETYLILLGDAAEAGHVNDSGDALELLLERPVLQRLRLHAVHAKVF